MAALFRSFICLVKSVPNCDLNMKRFFLILLALAPAVWAENDTSDVKVTVQSIDLLDCSDSNNIILESAAGEATWGPISGSGSLMNCTHNSPITIKITAEATTSPAAAGNDMILTVEVESGTGQKTVYDDNGAAGQHDMVAGLGAGTMTNKVITYTVQGTAAGTPVDTDTDFLFVITFTSVQE
jgi:hypothetical protein